jgi:hypothetical protein
MIEYEKAYRQGEILIFKVKSLKGLYLPHGMKRVRVVDGVIREGEKEGHLHQLDKKAQLDLFGTPINSTVAEDGVVEAKGNDVRGADTGVIQVLKDTARLTHPEHKPIDLPKGEYVMKVQKEAVGKNKSQSVKD